MSRFFYTVPALAAAMLAGCQSQPQPAVVAAMAPPEPTVPGRVTLRPNSPQLRRIRLQAVGLRQFPVDEIVAPGKVEANPNRISRVAVPVAGRIGQVFVKLGAAVEQGQPLVSVDSVEAGAAIAAYRQSQAQARMAASSLNKSDADLARLKELHAHKAAALKDVVAAQNDFNQAQAAVEQAQTARDEARHRLELLGLDPAAPSPVVTVRAPISGKVLDIAVVPGEFRNDTNAPLMTITDLSTVWIAADVPESVIRLIEIGEGIEVTLSAYPGQTFRARVMRIADVVDPQTRTVKVQAEISNAGGKLRPEMFGQIRHWHAMKTTPAVPLEAVLQLEGKSAVWLAEGKGVFRQVEIVTGPRQDGFLAVSSGLKTGDRVVVDGATLLGTR